MSALSFYGTFFFASILVIAQGLSAGVGTFANSEESPSPRMAAGAEEELLWGVGELYVPGSPGFLTIYDPSVATVVGGERYDWNPKVHHGIVAANSLGAGRIIGCSHTKFIDAYPEATPEQLGHWGMNQFVLNSVRWLSQLTSPNVLIVQQGANLTLETFLQGIGMLAETISPTNFSSADDLVGFHVVLVSDPLDESKAAILLQFVEQDGGGLLMALTAWAYSQFVNSPEHFGNVFPANQIASRAGFVWRSGRGDGYARPNTALGNFNASSQFVRNTNTFQVWPEIHAVLNGSEGSIEFNANPNQFISIVEMDLQAIPLGDEFFRGSFYEQMRVFVLDMERQPRPTAENPITLQDEKLRAQIFNLLANIILEPEEIVQHPASYYFPGTVAKSSMTNLTHLVNIHLKKTQSDFEPSSENQCVDPSSGTSSIVPKFPSGPFEEVEVILKHSRWFTTGIYAPAGRLIQVKLFRNNSDSELVYGIQVGCHTDDISRHAEWPRLPAITMTVPFLNDEAKFASPYGGLIYVTLPEELSTNSTEEFITVSITGGVAAPVFKLGETPLKEWRETIRYLGAPWAEFESESLILSAPQSSAALIDDPENLLLFWDMVMDAISDLTSSPRSRSRKERIVPDILISAGFMHSGYPIMTFLPEGDWAINATKLRAEGSWGHFHELGHNHQQSAWTFSGTGEVTCNLFSLYIFNTVLGIPAERAARNLQPEVYQPTVAAYIEGGTEFTEWQSEPWLALLLYYQLEREYGWGAYKKVFTKYNELLANERPTTDQEKIDLWLVMFSKVVEENLATFFVSWGIPFGVEAEDQISHFPEAMIRIGDLIIN